ncbi:MAG: Ig-like domain-containing protein, partial [Betaproteobacteria bacterium]
KNGTDVDTQTALSNYVLEHKLSGYTESKVISPITTLAAYFADSSKLNAALGLDSTLDITITDPIPNKGDKGPYDYLYEKGTQATVLALALTNIANNGFNQSQTTTTQTTFELIAKELEAQYTESNARVDIEREDFLAKVVERLSATLSTTISDANKATVSQALSNVLPVVEVKDNAAVTVAAMRFGLNLFQQDIAKLAAGTASSEVVTAYQSNILGYIAADQGVSADDLAPNRTAIDDNVTIDEDTEGQFNVLNNDSYLTAYEIGLSITSDPSHGSLSVTGGTVTYQPDPNYNGSDSFTYQITQGTKVSNATVNITINPINDAPELNFSSSFSVNENSTLVGVMSANDVDGDQLEVSLSGTNADLFTIDSNTFELNFKEAPDYESGNVSFAVTIVVKDAEFTVSRDIAITVNNLNDNAPTIDGPTSITIEENIYADLATYTTSDADGDTPAFKLGGADGDKFQILPVGRLSFKYGENDYEKQGTYNIEVIATDGMNETPLQVIVTVVNVLEQLGQTIASLKETFDNRTDYIAFSNNGEVIVGEQLGVQAETWHLNKASISWTNKQNFNNSSLGSYFGNDLSGDGIILALSSINGTCSSSGTGMVRIYEFDVGDVWQNLGSCIGPTRSGTGFGHSISLNERGDRFVVSERGGAQAYRLLNKEWIALGNFIESSSSASLNISVHMSGDGQEIAIGDREAANGSGEVKIFKLDGDEWKQIGQTITGDDNQGYGFQVKLDYMGETLVASNWDAGSISVFQFEGNAWELKGSSICCADGDSFDARNNQTTRVTMNNTGEVVAIGYPYARSGAGLVKLFKFNGQDW